jgi:hypothetical protein
MLKSIMWAGIALVGGLAILLAYAATRPDEFQVSRSINIKAPPDKIFALINDLKAFDRWNPFAKQDPSIALAYSGSESGPGAKSAWTSKGSAGAGTLEITGGQPGSEVKMLLQMTKPIEARNDIIFTLQPDGDSTKVTWAMSGAQPYIGKVISTIISMDTMVGGPFERGLADLKMLTEKQ